MIKLIKNELYKIFHKKGYFILLVIAIGCSLAGAVINVIDENNRFLSEQSLEGKKIAVKNTESGVEIDPFYAENKFIVESYKLYSEHPESKDYNSPEYYFINEKLLLSSMDYYQNKTSGADKDVLEEYKKELDKDMELINHFDWKKQIQDDINNAKTNITMCTEDDKNCKVYEEEVIRILQYRLDHNIPYSYNDASTLLFNYLDVYQEYIKSETDESKIKSHTKLYEKRNREARIKKTKYMVENQILDNKYRENDVRENFISGFKSINIFVILCILLVAGATVSDEFNKGTIKQLLVRPYNRSKILVSKFISVIIATLIFTVIYNIIDTILFGIVDGSIELFFDNIYQYSFSTGKVFAINPVVQALYSLVLSMPEIILLALLTITVSVLFTNNAVSIIIGLLAYISPSIISLMMRKVPILSFIPTLNWNWNDYIFGAISESEYLVYSKAIYVSIASAVILILLSIILFNHKDIKNQ